MDVQQIRDRFSSLGVTTNWKRFDRISAVRNDIEHYVPTATKAVLQEVISDACVIVRDFIVRELGGDPRVLLGNDTWQSMLDVSEVYEAERKACEDALGAIEWDSSTLEIGVGALSCENCGSGLLKPERSPASYADVDLVCSKCGNHQTPEEYVPKAVGEALSHEGYVAMTDGDEAPLIECPNCFEESYVMEEERCALCGHEAEHDCARCGTRIPPEELSSSPLCGYCDHVMSKDD